MRMYDLIEKKKLGKALTQQEIDWMVQGYTQGEIPDYQMSAFLLSGYEHRRNDGNDPFHGAFRSDV